jgi:dTDP-4-amino-4,6-dideoxygalactose transaminase
MIPVTKTYFPSIESYKKRMEILWGNGILTNRGEFVKELESVLQSKYGINHILCTNNGTIPIQIALKLFGGNGEVITTPFSYVATTAAISWENCTPVFVDIDPDYWCIDASKIEAAITSKTTCILATHVYGNPCNIEEIEKIAKTHNLEVIYDAAHCFGVKYMGKSIFNYGSISTCSFHATKLFHTGEGGALFCNIKEQEAKVFSLHNFGHEGRLEFSGLGINAKMNELSAAMGLCILPDIDDVILRRKNQVNVYLNNLNMEILHTFKRRENTELNFSYFPIRFPSHEKMLLVQSELNKLEVFPRRYFYPTLNHLPYVKNVEMPVAESLSLEIVCLPLYHDLSESDQIMICNVINKNI